MVNKPKIHRFRIDWNVLYTFFAWTVGSKKAWIWAYRKTANRKSGIGLMIKFLHVYRVSAEGGKQGRHHRKMSGETKRKKLKPMVIISGVFGIRYAA